MDTIINLNIFGTVRNIEVICICEEEDYIVSYILVVVQNNEIFGFE